MVHRLVPFACRAGLVFACWGHLGCGSPPPPPELVSGRVTVDGMPADRAAVRFYPAAGYDGQALVPTAVAEADGAFRIVQTHPSFTLPPGEYAVAVVWPEYTRQGGEDVEGKDRLGGKYATPERPAAKVTLRVGPNPLPVFELKK